MILEIFTYWFGLVFFLPGKLGLWELVEVHCGFLDFLKLKKHP